MVEQLMMRHTHLEKDGKSLKSVALQGKSISWVKERRGEEVKRQEERKREELRVSKMKEG